MNWSIWICSAIIIGCMGMAMVGLFHYQKYRHPLPSLIANTQDLAPGANKATLLLADGSKLMLDSTAIGHIAYQGQSLVFKPDSCMLAYPKWKPGVKEGAFNQLLTPRGGQYQLQLPDGSHVWLNAGSSLKFPAIFWGNERVVELEGEGYFEIAKNPLKPFHVRIKEGDIEALGTHFNVNDYPEEGIVKTTLLEGSVSIRVGNHSTLLKPGEQASWKEADNPSLQKNINTSDIIAWQTGLFSFHKEDIHTIMRQVARWYDVDIQYKGDVHHHFNATIERNLPVSKLLNLLEGTGDVHFEIKDKTIFVTP